MTFHSSFEVTLLVALRGTRGGTVAGNALQQSVSATFHGAIVPSVIPKLPHEGNVKLPAVKSDINTAGNYRFILLNHKRKFTKNVSAFK